MFTTQIEVDGKYIKGCIKKESGVYCFHAYSLSIKEKESYEKLDLEGFIDELEKVSNQLSQLNNPISNSR